MLEKVREECEGNVRTLRIFHLRFSNRTQIEYFEEKYGVEVGD